MLFPNIGAEIDGIDLSAELDAATLRFIRQALLKYLVIFFRDQNKLSEEAHINLARRFGEIHIHPAASGKGDDPSGLLKMKTNKEQQSRST